MVQRKIEKSVGWLVCRRVRSGLVGVGARYCAGFMGRVASTVRALWGYGLGLGLEVRGRGDLIVLEEEGGLVAWHRT